MRGYRVGLVIAAALGVALVGLRQFRNWGAVAVKPLPSMACEGVVGMTAEHALATIARRAKISRQELGEYEGELSEGAYEVKVPWNVSPAGPWALIVLRIEGGKVARVDVWDR